MSRYIDIEPYEKDGCYLEKRYRNSYGECIKIISLASIPTVDAEPKRGRWTKVGDSSWECSICHEVPYCNGNYCVDCGAKMFDKDTDVPDKNVGKMDEVEE